MPHLGAMLNRRRFVLGAVAATLRPTEIMARPLPSRSEVSLKLLAARKSLAISTAYDGAPDRRIRSLITHHCHLITPENALKPGFVAPRGASSIALDHMDGTIEFCRRNGLRLHGHTLFWHQSQPKWLSGTDGTELRRSYRRYLAVVLRRYADLIDSWDVLNEPLSDGASQLRRHPVLDRFGHAFIRFLFLQARELAPEAKLVLNDYNLSCGTDFCQRKRDHALFAIEGLLKAGTPIDVIGLQAHLAKRWPVRKTPLSTFVRRLEDLGLDVYISEMDVNDMDMPIDIPRRDALVAAIYRDYLGTVLEHANVKRLGFWGLSDASHWIVRGQAPFRRKSGTPRPALFDQDYQPKPAFFAVAEALREAPTRP